MLRKVLLTLWRVELPLDTSNSVTPCNRLNTDQEKRENSILAT